MSPNNRDKVKPIMKTPDLSKVLSVNELRPHTKKHIINLDKSISDEDLPIVNRRPKKSPKLSATNS
jgi:hypothetical protein